MIGKAAIKIWERSHKYLGMQQIKIENAAINIWERSK